MEPIDVITAIHHPIRRRIIDFLGLHGSSQVTTLATALDVQVGSMSHHLRMLERAGLVERVAAPDGDRRASWWQRIRSQLSWSTEDFGDAPAEALLAREAERANIRLQLQRLHSWHRSRASLPDWGSAAFSNDTLMWASATELADLSASLQKTIDAWRTAIDLEDGTERRPVFIFAHGFPTRA